MKTLQSENTVTINASCAKVWTFMTNPPLIKKYLFGTNVKTDWKVGGEITYEGNYNGKSYKDKGKILKFEPCEVFQSTYWSSIGGKEDIPENYNIVTYKLEAENGSTKITLTQDNIISEKELEHVSQNWKSVLESLKQLTESE